MPLLSVVILSMFAGMGDDLFDAAQMYDEDYLYFFAADEGTSEFATHGPAVPGAGVPGEAAAELAWRLLDLRPGMSVLDLACGHGEMAGQLAARGCEVTGLDSSAVFLDRARADAAVAGVSVEYVAGDMRELPWRSRFDRVVNWSTAFGYFDDAANRAVLDGSPAPCGPVAGWPWTSTTCPASSPPGPPHASWRQGTTATCSSTATTWTR
jgi:SAM-dependent methyltransferase